MPEQPLDGYVVTEVGDSIGVAFAGRLLAGYGATVIKVEPPRGSRIRSMPPFAPSIPDPNSSPLHSYLDGAKWSLRIDSSDADQLDELATLLENSDAVIMDISRSQLDDLFVSPPDLDNKIVVSSTPFGASGPRSTEPATALTAFAAGGQMAISGDPDREPVKVYGYQAEYQAGIHILGIVLTGLYAGEVDRVGTDIDLSVQDVQASSLEGAGPRSFNGADPPPRIGNIMSPIWRMYPCVDGYAGVWVNPPNVDSFFRSLDRPDLAAKYRDEMPTRHDDELEDLVGGLLSGLTKQEVFELAAEKGIPLSYVADLDDVLTSPYVADTGLWVDLEAGGVRTRLPGSPMRSSAMEFRTSASPTPGQHTAEVLQAVKDLSEGLVKSIAAALGRTTLAEGASDERTIT